MKTQQLTTPVALIIFNRPDVTAKIFKEIATARPKQLLVVSDGARESRPNEWNLVKQTRAILDQIDWPCEVKTNFSNTNLGCRRRVSSGIDWVFSEAERAIVLEDDCLPDQAFFRFCEEMLSTYQDNKQISMICGTNLDTTAEQSKESYYFSRYSMIWGWASWRDRWQGHYQVDMPTWPELKTQKWLATYLDTRREVDFWSKVYDSAYDGSVDTWDFQWQFANWVANRLSVIPSRNLISNIGFSKDATHTKSETALANLPLKTLDFPLRHPTNIVRSKDSDGQVFSSVFDRPLLLKALDRIKRAMV